MEGVGKVFRWTEAYSVRIALLDQQHQGLFLTVDELNQAMAAGRGNEVLVAVLRKLADYAVIHFAAEESLMEEHDFPGLSTHRAEHEMFRKKLAGFLEDHKGGKRGVPVSLMFFLQGWLKDHVQHADQLYSGFLNARGVH
jgi:hemerythrin